MNSDALCVIHVWFNFLCVCVLGGCVARFLILLMCLQGGCGGRNDNCCCVHKVVTCSQ